MQKDMEYIYAVYKYQSFSKAAKELFTSQPALSATIKKVENNLKTPLFDRSTHPIRLTEAGKYYIKQVEKIMTIENDMENYFKDLDSLNTGTISIGTSPAVSSYFLSNIIHEFKKKFPQISFDLHEASNPELFSEWLKNGTVDFIFAIMPIGGNDCIHIPFLDEQLILAVPKSNKINDSLIHSQLSYEDVRHHLHYRTNAPAISLKHFSDETFILSNTASDMYQRSMQMFKNVNASPKEFICIDQNITSYFMTANEYGISIIRDEILHLVINTNNIVFYKIDDPLSLRTLMIHYKKDRYLSKTSSAFIEYIKARNTSHLT